MQLVEMHGSGTLEIEFATITQTDFAVSATGG